MYDRIGNAVREGDLVEFLLPTNFHLVVATVEKVEEGGVLTAGPQGMKLPPKLRLHIDITCNLTDPSGVFQALVVVKNPKQNEPAANA
jgi:hypothetical protein